MPACGIEAYQAFGTADLGLIAFETRAREGMYAGISSPLVDVRR